MFNISQSKKGFTLVEAIITIFVVLVGVVGLLTVLSAILISVSVSSSRLTAAYLAKEGVEIARNIRDTNWLERADNSMWKEDIPNSGDWEVDYQSQGITEAYGGGRFLNIDSNGFYSYSAGTPTAFKRKISLSSGTDSFNVKVTIDWSRGNKDYSFVAEEVLYNWR